MPVRRNNQTWLPSIFNDFFDNEWMEKANATAPAINVSESEREYKVEVAAPGMTKEDFNIHIDEDNNLVISMEKKTDNKEEKKDRKYLRREFSYSKFEQTMILPDGRCGQGENRCCCGKRSARHHVAKTQQGESSETDARH